MDDAAKATVKEIVKHLGGKYTIHMTRQNTHLVVERAAGQKFFAAPAYGVVAVTPEWLLASADAGALLCMVTWPLRRLCDGCLQYPQLNVDVQASCCLRQTSIRRRRHWARAGKPSTRALRVFPRRVLDPRSCRSLDGQFGESCGLASGLQFCGGDLYIVLHLWPKTALVHDRQGHGWSQTTVRLAERCLCRVVSRQCHPRRRKPCPPCLLCQQQKLRAEPWRMLLRTRLWVR